MAHGGKIRQGFREMIREYLHLADHYRQKTYSVIQKISPFLETNYLLSLHIIFNLYLMVYERIDYASGNFSTGELNPTTDEIRERVYRTILEFQDTGYQ
jgi:hypothetical protein